MAVEAHLWLPPDPGQLQFTYDTLLARHLVKGVAFPVQCLTGPDPSTLFQNKNLDWFPRMRAMSLVSSEGEGEQNEIRILQEKLGSTMKLVSHLTAQLNELKEQVSSRPRGPQCLHLRPFVQRPGSACQGSVWQELSSSACRHSCPIALLVIYQLCPAKGLDLWRVPWGLGVSI